MSLTPSPEESFPPVLPTGNAYVSLPHIDPVTGAIPDFYVISARAAGLVGVRGGSAPLLRVIGQDGAGTIVPFVPQSVGREDAWIPTLTGHAGPIAITVRIIPPPQERGFAIVVEAEPGSKVGLEVHWEETVLAIFRTRTLPVRPQLRWDAWTSSICGEAQGPLPILGWAVAAEEPADAFDVRPAAGGWRAMLQQRTGRDGRAVFFVTVAREEDGARTTVVHMRRLGADRLQADTRRWLRERRVALRDPALEERANLNLLFNRFYATGLTIDTEEPRALTSRSPRYYVSGAFWARDALLWSLPGLLVHDSEWALTVLRAILRTTWPQGAEHALYLNGVRLYPGFELDQLCAYPIAVHQANAAVPGWLQEDPVAAEVLRQFPDVLAAHFDKRTGLYRTFLDPSDDPPPDPFLTYDNILAWQALEICAAATQARRDSSSRPVGRADPARMAHLLRSAIHRRCVDSGPFGSMYAWATDGRGKHTRADNPAGSLLMLPYHRFCRPADPVWRSTLRWIYSSENPFFIGGPFAAPANRHAAHPWPMAACHLIFCGQRARGAGFLRRAEMDGGIACETVDAQTGRVRTGGAFAALAGYVGAALHHALAAPRSASPGDTLTKTRRQTRRRA